MGAPQVAELLRLLLTIAACCPIARVRTSYIDKHFDKQFDEHGGERAAAKTEAEATVAVAVAAAAVAAVAGRHLLRQNEPRVHTHLLPAVRRDAAGAPRLARGQPRHGPVSLRVEAAAVDRCGGGRGTAVNGRGRRYLGDSAARGGSWGGARPMARWWARLAWRSSTRVPCSSSRTSSYGLRRGRARDAAQPAAIGHRTLEFGALRRTHKVPVCAPHNTRDKIRQKTGSCSCLSFSFTPFSTPCMR
jgi:hypothetical protein